MSSSLRPQVLLFMEFSRQEYGVGSHALLQEIFLTQGLNQHLLHYRQILYHLSHQGNPLTPQPGIKPMSPASEGRFLTTKPPGKS